MGKWLAAVVVLAALPAFADKRAPDLKGTFSIDVHDSHGMTCAKLSATTAKAIKKLRCSTEKASIRGDKQPVAFCTTVQRAKKPVPYYLFFETMDDCEAERAAQLKDNGMEGNIE